MKYSWIPFLTAFILWLIFAHFRRDLEAAHFEVTWSYGPFVIIGAGVLSIIKGIHFSFYNSKKRLV